MKNYSNSVEESKLFITNYEIKDGSIIIYPAKGNSWILPYSKENESKILRRMENQVIEARKSLEDMKKANKGSASITAVLLFIFILNILAAAIGSSNSVINIIIVASGLATTLESSVILHRTSKKREIEEMSQFLDSKQEINRKINENPNITNGISEKAMGIIAKEKEITVNNLRSGGISLADLKRIRENIEIARRFHFSYVEQRADEDTEISSSPSDKKRKFKR